MKPLLQIEDTFRNLLDATPDAILVSNVDGEIVLVNQMIERMLGYRRQELIGKPVELLMPERFRSGHVGLRMKYVDQPQTRFMGGGMELAAQHKDGHEIPVEISLSPIQVGDEMLVTCAIRDVSEHQKIQQTLEQHAQDLERSNSELQQFAYVASHDLQEPLRVIASFSQLLSRRYKGQLDADADEFIDYIVDAASRMQDLINDLLAYSRVTTKEREHQSTDFNEVLARVQSNLRIAIEEHAVQISVAPLPTLMADELQIEQLFQNLISNAIKFHADAASQVHVTVEETADEYVFAVKDNGIGMDEQYAERIFAVFQRLHTKQEYPGTGIGLAICKKIVERHQGRIWLKSSPGHGTTFFFTIPR